jgi:hypothetical protein
VITKLVAKVSVSSSAPSGSTAALGRPISSSHSRSAAASSDGVLGIDGPAGEPDLPAMSPDGVGPLREHEVRLTSLDERHQHRRAHERARRDDPTLARRQPPARELRQLVEGHEVVRRTRGETCNQATHPANTSVPPIPSATLIRKPSITA